MVDDLEAKVTELAQQRKLQAELQRTRELSRLEELKKLHERHEAERKLAALAKPRQKIEVRESEDGLEEVAANSLIHRKGALSLPVDGPILSGFGKSFDAKTNLYTFQKGITIGVAHAEPVKSVSEGKVVYSGPLKNYGQLVIVEHPGSYYSLYGQLSNVSVREGERVEENSVLGESGAEPIYFEIRNQNIAVNPKDWVAKK